MTYRVEIPLKLPGCNDYIRACRTNKYMAAKMKREVEDSIIPYLSGLPHFEKPVVINFYWVEGNKRRDLDGIAFGKKFVLDALVKAKVLKDDNRKMVTAFRDNFSYEKEPKVILEIEEQNED